MKRLLLFPFAAALLAACAAPPEPGSRLHVGDSLTVQAYYGYRIPPNTRVVANLGWSASTPDLVNGHTAALVAGASETIVIALGTNDSYPGNGLWPGDGWTDADARAFESLLLAAHPESCQVVLLPWLGSAAPAAHRVEVAEARDALMRIAEQTGVAVSDAWRAEVEASGESILSSDGIHLRVQDGASTSDGVVRPVDPVAAAARHRAMADAEEACE